MLAVSWSFSTSPSRSLHGVVYSMTACFSPEVERYREGEKWRGNGGKERLKMEAVISL